MNDEIRIMKIGNNTYYKCYYCGAWFELDYRLEYKWCFDCEMKNKKEELKKDIDNE